MSLTFKVLTSATSVHAGDELRTSVGQLEGNIILGPIDLTRRRRQMSRSATHPKPGTLDAHR